MRPQKAFEFDDRNCIITPDQVNSPSALFSWARERHNVYLKRFHLKKEKPWTKDTFISSFRFCNVYREIDTVSIWIKENIIDVYEDKPYLWYLLAIARSINHVETIK